MRRRLRKLSCLRRLWLVHQSGSASRATNASEAVFLQDVDEGIVEDNVVVRTVARGARALVEVFDAGDASIAELSRNRRIR